MPDSKVDIEASRKLIAAATPGPWTRGWGYDEETGEKCGDLSVHGPDYKQTFSGETSTVSDTVFVAGFSHHARHRQNLEFAVAARDPLTGWPAALTELEEAEILVAKWEKSCEILANEKIAAVRDWQLAYKELEEARQELGIFRRDLMVATLGMPSSEDADDEDRVDWLCRIAVEGEVARAELKRRDEPVQVQKQRLSGHSSRIATCECKAVILNGTEKFCPNCGRHLEWA